MTWLLDPAITYLNHGSFGACPQPVLDLQARLRRQIEEEPVRFFVRDLEGLLDDARGKLAAYVGANPEELAFVPNATTGVNAVLRSIPLEPGDALLTTDHAYNACRNALDWAASKAGAEVIVAEVPFPLSSSQQVIDAILGAVTPKTRLVLVDHVTSPTALRFPVEELVPLLDRRGIDCLVDGAHAPGMLPIDLTKLGAAYYTGNCHKWLCAPKGAGFLWVRKDRQATVRPPVISHGANSRRTDRSRFQLEFDWQGTFDPTAYLCVPEAIRFVGSLVPGGWPELMERNRQGAISARDLICAGLGLERPCPDDMLGSMAALPLSCDATLDSGHFDIDPLQAELFSQGIEVPIFIWPRFPKRVLRVSCQLYNSPAQYQRLVSALEPLVNGQKLGRP